MDLNQIKGFKLMYITIYFTLRGVSCSTSVGSHSSKSDNIRGKHTPVKIRACLSARFLFPTTRLVTPQYRRCYSVSLNPALILLQHFLFSNVCFFCSFFFSVCELSISTNGIDLQFCPKHRRRCFSLFAVKRDYKGNLISFQ